MPAQQRRHTRTGEGGEGGSNLHAVEWGLLAIILVAIAFLALLIAVPYKN
jgi:hypothetical protein